MIPPEPTCPCGEERTCSYHYHLILLEYWGLAHDTWCDPGELISDVILAYVETFDRAPAMYEKEGKFCKT